MQFEDTFLVDLNYQTVFSDFSVAKRLCRRHRRLDRSHRKKKGRPAGVNSPDDLTLNMHALIVRGYLPAVNSSASRPAS
jgi:hypothetical protein